MLAPNKDYVDLSKPSVEGLAWALRHREVWPTGFGWDFMVPHKCAIGLAHRLWPEKIEAPCSYDVLRGLGMVPPDADMADCEGSGPFTETRDIFFRNKSGGPVQPEDVAERLEAFASEASEAVSA